MSQINIECYICERFIANRSSVYTVKAFFLFQITTGLTVFKKKY